VFVTVPAAAGAWAQPQGVHQLLLEAPLLLLQPTEHLLQVVVVALQDVGYGSNGGHLAVWTPWCLCVAP